MKDGASFRTLMVFLSAVWLVSVISIMFLWQKVSIFWLTPLIAIIFFLADIDIFKVALGLKSAEDALNAKAKPRKTKATGTSETDSH